MHMYDLHKDIYIYIYLYQIYEKHIYLIFVYLSKS